MDAVALSDLELGKREDVEAALIASVIDARRDEWEPHEWPERVRAEAWRLGVAVTRADVSSAIGAATKD